MITFQADILPLKNELYRLALRITMNAAEAEDVVQETMMKVWNRREQWEQIESIEAFCLTICRNLSLDKLRRMDNQTQSLDAAYDPKDFHVASNPEEQAVQRDRIQLVRQLINMLPEKQRSCMQLRDMEGKSYKDIAAILGITEEQVKVNIFRARQTIKERFQKIENNEKIKK
jgi:RNA polymerase sigma-70 factor (ECF subfamily)